VQVAPRPPRAHPSTPIAIPRLRPTSFHDRTVQAPSLQSACTTHHAGADEVDFLLLPCSAVIGSYPALHTYDRTHVSCTIHAAPAPQKGQRAQPRQGRPARYGRCCASWLVGCLACLPALGLASLDCRMPVCLLAGERGRPAAFTTLPCPLRMVLDYAWIERTSTVHGDGLLGSGLHALVQTPHHFHPAQILALVLTLHHHLHHELTNNHSYLPDTTCTRSSFFHHVVCSAAVRAAHVCPVPPISPLLQSPRRMCSL
jgi:hypothetical protein